MSLTYISSGGPTAFAPGTSPRTATFDIGTGVDLLLVFVTTLANNDDVPGGAATTWAGNAVDSVQAVGLASSVSNITCLAFINPTDGSQTLSVGYSGTSTFSGNYWWVSYSATDTPSVGTAATAEGTDTTVSIGSQTCPSGGALVAAALHQFANADPVVNSGTSRVATRLNNKPHMIADRADDGTFAWNALSSSQPWSVIVLPISVGGGDTTAPVLSSPTGTATGSTTATVGATTDEANGTQYAYVSTSATPPSGADLKAGTGAVWAGSITISSTGANTHSATGLTASTDYYAHLIHTDAAANDSNIVTSAQFTTSAPAENPVITSQPSNATVKRGQTATFTTAATGSGTVTYQWQRNPGGVGSWADISGATSASYTTPATTVSGGSANDQDDYRCNVSDDDAGPVASDVVTLTVQQCVLDISSDTYIVGDGNSPATMSVAGSYVWKVNVHDYTSDSLGDSAQVYQNASVTAGANGKLANIGDDDLIFGQWYLLTIRSTTGQLVLSAAIQAS